MVIALREVTCGKASAFVLDAISKFKCQDRDVETFIKEKAFEYERRDKSRTYLIFDVNGNRTPPIPYTVKAEDKIHYVEFSTELTPEGK